MLLGFILKISPIKKSNIISPPRLRTIEKRKQKDYKRQISERTAGKQHLLEVVGP